MGGSMGSWGSLCLGIILWRLMGCIICREEYWSNASDVAAKAS